MSGKTLIWALLLIMAVTVAFADPPPPQQADPISIDRASPSVVNFGNLPADIYGEAGGPPVFGGWDVGGPGPILHIAAATYGLGNADNNDAHSLGHNDPNWIPIVYFSANRRAKGMFATQYRHQALRNQAAGDRFVTNGWMSISPAVSYASGTQANLVVWLPGMGPNLLSANQTRYNEIPSIWPGMVNPVTDPTRIDDMDALELHPMDPTGEHIHVAAIFFSLDPASPAMPAGGSAADIFISPPGTAAFWVWASAASMGLQTTDDIDALVVFNVSGEGEAVPGTDYALFSLKPGNSLGADPCDVYVTCFQGISRLYFIGQTIGLRLKDNLDGLDIEQHVDGQNVPQVYDEIEITTPPPFTPIWPGREYPDGTLINTSGIVTVIGDDFLYIEAPDSSSGIRVETIPSWLIEPGDELEVIGTLGLLDGERVIYPPDPSSPITTDNPIPEIFGMRAHDVGGNAVDALNPGVTNGRGPLNVGLLVHVSGMVTARDPASDPQWFYLWDGSNMFVPGPGVVPLNDGSGNYGVRVVSDFACEPWIDWVGVTGVVSTNASAVPGHVIPEILPYDGPFAIDSFFDVYASPGTVLGSPKKNLLSIPAAPANTGLALGGFQPWAPSEIFPPGRTELEINNRLLRWETANQSYIGYSMFSEPNGRFGGALLGDGYWLNPPADWPLSYTGLPSTLSQWTGTGPAGYRLIGHPQESETMMTDLLVHNGSEIKALEAASQRGAGWVNSKGIYWINLTSSFRTVGLLLDFPNDNRLRPWYGYWFRFLQDDKAFIVPGKPRLEFSQLDFELDSGVIPDSEWGDVALSQSGSPNLQYFNLTVNGSWQVQNVPVLPDQGVGVWQTVHMQFDLGVPRGNDVANIDYGYSLTLAPLASAPATTATAVVDPKSIVAASGIQGLSIPPPSLAGPLAGRDAGSWNYLGGGMPNQPCGPNECVPAAVSNSVQYLNTQHGLGLSGWQTGINQMKNATGWSPTGAPANWPTGKSAWMAANGYPINTTPINFSQIQAALAAGYDVEIDSKWHSAVVVGITDLGGGDYSIQVQHDTDQNNPGAGCQTDTITYHAATNSYSGSPGFFDGSQQDLITCEYPAGSPPP